MQKKTGISVLGLTMINLAALGGIRSWAPIAECGMVSIFFLFFGIVFFFIPLAFVSAELASTYSGGIYDWIKRAFGHKVGFLAVWFLWIENVLYYPMMLTFIASTITYVVNPSLVSNKAFAFGLPLIIFWATTLINLKGVKASTWVSTVGAICGTFIPSILIILFGSIWFLNKNPIEMHFSVESLVPKMELSTLSLFAGVIFSLFGIEMSTIHCSRVENPQKKYPRAILFTVIFTVLFSIMGVLSISMVIPESELILSAGALQAFGFFTKHYHLESFLPLLSMIIVIGALGSMSTWVVGPCVGLIEAAKDKDLPPLLKKVDAKGNPRNLLIAQALIVSAVLFLFLFTETVNNAYWIFLVLSTQFYLLMYILLFCSMLKLRRKDPTISRPFQVPGGKIGALLSSAIGLLISIGAFVISFFPPAIVPPGKETQYFAVLFIFIGLFSIMPLFFSRKEKLSKQYND